ncbi:putative quinate permease [Rhypophila sp. PSN 637]
MATDSFSKAAWRLHVFCLLLAFGSYVWGYNIGILASVLAHPGFRNALGIQDAPLGLITGIYYLGTWLSYIFVAHPAADKLGRRYAALGGMLVLCVGQALQASASGTIALGQLIIGRIVSGLGTGVVSTSVPLYQSEISPAKQRGRFVVMNHIGFVAGLASGFWVGYAFTFWDNEHGRSMGWRVSIALSFIPACIFLACLPFLYESPRWLVEHGKSEKALKTLTFYREGSFTSDDIHHELSEIERSVSNFKSSGLDWTSLFTDPGLFARMWRSTLLQFMAQMCGVTAMKYYLPILFKALGLSPRTALLAGGIEMTLKIGCTVVEMLIIDNVGRRPTLTFGAAVMAFSMMVNGALPLAFPDNSSRAADFVCIMFIFIYSFGYGISFGPAAWVYGSEIFPTAIRARGLSFAASGGSIGSIITAQVWPVGIRTLGSNTYFFFMAINLVCVPIVYLLYPETKGRSLEDMDVLFRTRHHDIYQWQSPTGSQTNLLEPEEAEEGRER